MTVAQRINLSVLDEDEKRLRRIYEERYLPYRMGDKLSFTGFCTMMLMFAAEVVEGTDYKFTYAPTVRRPGKPREGEE